MFTEQQLNRLRYQIRRELVQLAKTKGGRIYYSELGFSLSPKLYMKNPSHRRTLSDLLSQISEEELQPPHRRRPLLSALVVNKRKSIPGDGFFDLARRLTEYNGEGDPEMFWQDQLKRVRRCRW